MLTIRRKRRLCEPQLPYVVFLDGLYVGTLKNGVLQIDVPCGSYDLRVQCGGRIPIGKRGKYIDISVSSTKRIEVSPATDSEYLFHDRERLWNILFDIDLIVWAVSWFVEMSPLYKIISDAFFAVWLVRLVLIRKKYYKIISKEKSFRFVADRQ